MAKTANSVLTLADVRAHRDDILTEGQIVGISNVRVFGSVARGEAGASSDLDLLVDVEPGRGYFDLTTFALAVEDMLGVFTQVATVNGLKRRIRDEVLAESVAL